MPPQEREALVARLTLNRYTDKTIKTGKQLLRRITAEANRGWHINLAEHQADTLSVAAPLVLYGSPLALVVGARWTARRPRPTASARRCSRPAGN